MERERQREGGRDSEGQTGRKWEREAEKETWREERFRKKEMRERAWESE